MPIFDFECPLCHARATNVILKMSHTAVDFPTCVCTGNKMEKQPSIVNSKFNGAGSHAVDYRSPTRGF